MNCHSDNNEECFSPGSMYASIAGPTNSGGKGSWPCCFIWILLLSGMITIGPFIALTDVNAEISHSLK